MTTQTEEPPGRREMQGRGIIYNDFSETVGFTPLVRISRFCKAYGVKANVLLKLEFFNPLSSVKDRISMAMIRVLEGQGKITPGHSVLIEPTSGNTGIALAYVAAARGYRLIVVMPETMSLERRKLLKHLGAELELTPGELGIPGAVARAKELVESTPYAVIPGQFDNPANPTVHQLTTAEEIWYDTGGQVDAIVVGIGTGGTLTGCADALLPRNPNLRMIAVEPAHSPVLSEGRKGKHKIQGIGAGFVRAVLKTDAIHEVIQVQDDNAFKVARALAKIEGIPGGISTGANLAAILQLDKRQDMTGKTIVTFAPSSAERYLSSDLVDRTNNGLQ